MRKFALLAVCAALLLQGCGGTKPKPKADGKRPAPPPAHAWKGALRHVVLIKFKDGTTPEQIETLKEGCREMQKKIAAIQAIEWGKDVSVEKLAQGFTHCILVTFKDAAGRDAYLPHPEHKAFAEPLTPLLDKVLVVDFVAGNCRAKDPAAKSYKGKLRHVVLFQYKDGTTPEQAKTIRDAFCALPGKVPEVIAFECGTDCSVEELAGGFGHAFVVTFENAEGRGVYLPHPEHKAFAEVLTPHMEKVLVVDYVVEE